MASIAVREGVDGDKLVAEPDRDFIGLVGFILCPVSDIIDKLAHFRRDAIGINSDVSGAPAIFSGPFPDLPEHVLVQFFQERVVQYIGIALPPIPAARLGDVDLLGFVELAAQRDTC